MHDYLTLRETFRVPWIRENRRAVHYLSDLFYLQLALYRAGRMQDFLWVRGTYFRMLHAFAQYGRREAKTTVRQFLRIPWFQAHRRQIYRLISAYNRVRRHLPGNDALPILDAETRDKLQAAARDYVAAMKILIRFDERDESRIRLLLRDAAGLDAMLSDLFGVVV